MELAQKIKECQDEIKKITRSEIDVFVQEKGDEDIRNFVKECVVNQIMLYLIHQEFFGDIENLEQKAH